VYQDSITNPSFLVAAADTPGRQAINNPMLHARRNGASVALQSLKVVGVIPPRGAAPPGTMFISHLITKPIVRMRRDGRVNKNTLA
jgi:hypothetical protein